MTTEHKVRMRMVRIERNGPGYRVVAVFDSGETFPLSSAATRFVARDHALGHAETFGVGIEDATTPPVNADKLHTTNWRSA